MEYSDYCINVIKLANNEDEYKILINIFNKNSDIYIIDDTYDYICYLKTLIKS